MMKSRKIVGGKVKDRFGIVTPIVHHILIGTNHLFFKNHDASPISARVNDTVLYHRFFFFSRDFELLIAKNATLVCFWLDW
jgi:hypothetical protein